MVLLLAPTAHAGDEDDPEVDDARDLRDASLDLLSAWFSPDPDGVRFTIKVAELDEDDAADHLYFIAFTMHGAKYLAGIGYDGDGDLHGHAGDATSLRNARGIETFDDNLDDLDAQGGAPGYLSAVIPWGALDGLEPDVVLVDIAAGTSLFHRERGAWEPSVDARGTDRTYAAKRVLVRPGWAPWLAVGAVAVVLAGAGGAVAFLVAKKKRAAPAPVRVPVQAAAPPPSAPREPPKPRFSLRPPE